MSKHVHRFPPFYNGPRFSPMNICTHVLARPYPNNTRVSVTGSYASSPSPLFLSTLPSLSLSPSLSVTLSLCHSFQTRCGYLECSLV
ncbi:unnamed protein product [Hymenolepis diminuta]|uniref:Uncharacterized protein n=1 Tax=Hymenolepis diminuta TaxID=6216 RepID=A0A564Y5M1_HYMDI|nr:unnamed protein product [Hymenolepis diminuta]